MSEIILYDYWRSSASYRVRIALNLVSAPYRTVRVDLLAREHASTDHLKRNPQGLVPALEIDGVMLTQSLAMIEYLDETCRAGLLPEDAASRARVRALAYAIAMDIHPVCNLGTVNRAMEIADPARGTPEDIRADWMRHFIGKGLAAVEEMLGRMGAGRFCHGEAPGLGDICLIPQVYNAHRWGVDISRLERIERIVGTCESLPAFIAAHPDKENSKLSKF